MQSSGITMTILKRGNSKYWYIQFQLAGRTIIKSSRTTSRKAAEQIEAQLRSQTHAERYLGQRPSITFEQALDRFIEGKSGTPNHRNLLGHKRTILAIIGASMRMDDLTTEKLEEFKRFRIASGASAQTLSHGIDLIRCAWKLVKRQGYRVGNVTFPSVESVSTVSVTSRPMRKSGCLPNRSE